MMWQINRHVVIAIAKGYLVVMLILVLLFCLIMFIEELDELGTGAYELHNAVHYTVLMIPKLLVDLTSIAGLIGVIVGLGVLAKNSELVAIQAIGISPKHIAKLTIIFGVAIMIIIYLANQFILPYTTRSAHIGKVLAINDSNDLVGETGFWSQNKRVFLHVEDTILGKNPHNVEIFEFNEKRELTRYIHAKNAFVNLDSSWLLEEVQIRDYKDGEIETSKENHFLWQSILGSSQTAIINAAQESLSITDLYRYVQSLKERGERYANYELLFWQKLSSPIITITMMLIGIIFMLGSLRSTTISTRITVAIILSVFFYLLNQIIVHTGMLLQLPALLVVMVPLMIISIVAIAMLQLKK